MRAPSLRAPKTTEDLGAGRTWRGEGDERARVRVIGWGAERPTYSIAPFIYGN